MHELIEEVRETENLPKLARAIRDAVEADDHKAIFEVAAAAIGHRINDQATPTG